VGGQGSRWRRAACLGLSAGGAVIVIWMREAELLCLSNHHSAAGPAIGERPGRYLVYFVNKFGEQLVFVHDDGEADATVFHGDVDWEPRRIIDADGLPDAGDLILGDEERLFVIACWVATAWRREAAQAGRSAA
jgi:hypothetical protein